jgi:pimeloyl-ACP methyl ester carboxylesterase
MEPFRIDVPQRALDDLAWRLRHARWPRRLLVASGEDVFRLEQVERLLSRWRDEFDWREHERRINALPHYQATVGGIRLHFIWVKSVNPSARPLLLLNGWPSSFVEYLGVLGPLAEAGSGIAFDVIIPARPGYGFSDSGLDHPGTDDDVADLFARLMSERLGYRRFLVHGDDFGGSIASRIAWRHPALVEALHVAEWLDPSPPPASSLTPEEKTYLRELDAWRRAERAYGQIAGTRPQTIGFAFDDSPLGLLAWIVDKFLSWTPAPSGNWTFDDDVLLATATLYWVTQSMTSSMRPYALPVQELSVGERIVVPTGVVAPREGRPAPPRSWIERSYADLRSYRARERGGHFYAAESPGGFVAELRQFFTDVTRR